MPESLSVCVCGAGTMGSGIAQVAAQSGFNTILFDVYESILEKSKATIEYSLNKLIQKGKIDNLKKEKTLQKIKFTTNIHDCVANIIIEAIIEEKTAKISLFKQLQEINTANTIFTTNTSSLSITEIATQVKNEERFCGMHFFNPAPVMKLVEIIKTEKTTEKVIEQLIAMAEQMGKSPVVCKDAPGFIVNRVARQFYLEAMELVGMNVADVETVDAAMEAAGFRMGPFKLMDLIGIDVNYSVSEIVWNALGKPERLKPSSLQKEKIENRFLGRKSGKGFYSY